jgi:hypothetical protein
MSGGDVLGDLAQGALTARAFEPNHGEANDDGHTHESACLNCGTPLVGRHCHQCGQAAHVHRTLRGFIHDLLHGVFHFEGKIWRTLPLLAWNPGKLTREYIAGRRASYVSPIALFLFVVFLTFAVFNALGDPIHFDNDPKTMAAAKSEADQAVADLETKAAAARARGEDVRGLNGQLTGARAARDAIGSVQNGSLPASAASSERISSFEPLNEAWRKAKSNPDLLVFKLQTNAYKFSWLLIPLSVPFLWLLFPFNRRFHLYDHTVFVTYSLSFMLLLTALISLVVVWGQADGLIAALIFYAPFHIYRQLRHAYGLTRFGAWWRTWILSLFAVTVLVLFALALTMIAATG